MTHKETQVNTCLAIFTKAITSDSEETDGEYFKHNNALKDIERISDKRQIKYLQCYHHEVRDHTDQL